MKGKMMDGNPFPLQLYQDFFFTKNVKMLNIKIRLKLNKDLMMWHIVKASTSDL